MQRKLSKEEVLIKIRDFSNLPVGWDLDFGNPISEPVIDYTCSLLEREYCSNEYFYFRTNVYPTPNSDGGITITFSNGEVFLDLIINSDLSLNIVKEVGFGVNYQIEYQRENISVFQLIKEIYELF